MAQKVLGTSILGLRSKGVDELRAIALRYLAGSSDDIASLDKQSLISELSRAASNNAALTQELKGSITIKPSFYLMILAPKDAKKPSVKQAQIQLRTALNKLNTGLNKGTEVPAYKNFHFEDIVERDKNIIEIQFTWERIYRFWSPEIVYEHIYELQFGYAILDFGVCKAVITCHTLKERDHLVEALAHVGE